MHPAHHLPHARCCTSARAAAPCSDGPWGSFVESLMSLLRMHRDHEPFRACSSRPVLRSSTAEGGRESAQTSSMKNERTHVRCYQVRGMRLCLAVCGLLASASAAFG